MFALWFNWCERLASQRPITNNFDPKVIRTSKFIWFICSCNDTEGVGRVTSLGYTLTRAMRWLPGIFLHLNIHPFRLLSGVLKWWARGQEAPREATVILEVSMYDRVHLQHQSVSVQKEKCFMPRFLFFRIKAWAVLRDQNPQLGPDHGPWSSWGPLLKAYGK